MFRFNLIGFQNRSGIISSIRSNPFQSVPSVAQLFNSFIIAQFQSMFCSNKVKRLFNSYTIYVSMRFIFFKLSLAELYF